MLHRAVHRARLLALRKLRAVLSPTKCRGMSSLGGNSGGGAGGGYSFPTGFPLWPWVCAGVTGSVTLYSANYMRSDDLYKAAVQELSRRDGLRSLQLMMMMFGVFQP